MHGCVGWRRPPACCWVDCWLAAGRANTAHNLPSRCPAKEGGACGVPVRRHLRGRLRRCDCLLPAACYPAQPCPVVPRRLPCPALAAGSMEAPPSHDTAGCAQRCCAAAGVAPPYQVHHCTATVPLCTASYRRLVAPVRLMRHLAARRLLRPAPCAPRRLCVRRLPARGGGGASGSGLWRHAGGLPHPHPAPVVGAGLRVWHHPGCHCLVAAAWEQQPTAGGASLWPGLALLLQHTCTAASPLTDNAHPHARGLLCSAGGTRF